MKIALTGPHCSGKSTVFRRIADRFSSPNTLFVKYDGNRSPIDYCDIARLRKTPELEIDLTFWMVSDLILREIDTNQNAENIVLDRCVIDQLVYPEAILGSIPEGILKYIEYWVNHRPYDQIFLFPRNERLLLEYGTKDRDITFLRRIEEGYKGMLDKYNLKYLLLPEKQEEQTKVLGNELERLLK